MIAHSIYWSLQTSKENACVADIAYYIRRLHLFDNKLQYVVSVGSG